MSEELAPGVVEFEHTADLGMEVEACSLEELFHRAAAGMMVLVRERNGVDDGVTASHSVPPAGHATDGQEERIEERLLELEHESEDVAGLLVRWLRELLFLQEVEGFVYGEAEFDRLDGSGLRVRVRSAPAPAPPVRELKGVTYHGLEVARRNGTWHARVIFDI